MILTDREIKLAITKKQIEIIPQPIEEAFSSTAVDLTLASIARCFNAEVDAGISLDPGKPGFKFHKIQNMITEQVSCDPQLELKRGHLLLAWTAEWIKLPTHSRIAARVEGKSSLARLGIGIHVTAPIIHAGFEGQIQLEIVNHGPTDVILRKDMRICQLVFETTLGAPEKGYTGMFLGQQAT